MTEELKKKLLDFSNSREPFLTHNHMYTADIGDGSAAVVLPMCRDSLNRWGGAHPQNLAWKSASECRSR